MSGNGERMQYLVQMMLAARERPARPEEGIAFIEQYVVPSLELCKTMQADRKILAGGPTSGAIGIAMIVEAGSARELDDVIENLPIWPQMETIVTPLTTFGDRIDVLRPRLQRLKSRLQSQPA